MDKRFFGPATPFVAIAALAVSMLAYALLRGLGLVLVVLLLVIGIVGTVAHGRTRQVCTGIATGALVFLAGFAIVGVFFLN
ncbi:hypothetical protein [Gordonia metallireducens]|uniref:hypothetical protein n=1 Tax=Gordonia metallireducens TaxID=2897779 RepID=UPI001E370C0B|nr:hypothetical protein [Gordonia metallireducens]